MRTDRRTDMAMQVVAVRFKKAPKHFPSGREAAGLSVVFLHLDGARLNKEVSLARRKRELTFNLFWKDRIA